MWAIWKNRLIWRYRRMVIRGSKRAGGRAQFLLALRMRAVALVIGCLAAMLMVAPGCSSTPKPPPPLGADMRATLGMVGVVSNGPVSATLSGPVGVNREIGKGALKGGGIGGLGGAGTGALLGLGCGPCAPGCVPVFALLGGLGGLAIGAGTGAAINGFDAIPTDAAEKIQGSLVKAIGDEDVQADLRRRVISVASSANSKEPVDLGIAVDYVPFTMRGMDTVLEINITQIAFAGSGGSNPDLALTMNVNVRLIRIANNQVIWSNNQITFTSKEAEFTQWAMEDAQALKSAIAAGLDSLARQINENVFLLAMAEQ